LADVKFTKHATEKFGLLRTFGFTLTQDQVASTIAAADKRENRGQQTISTKVLDGKFALRVVHEERKGIIVVITFYPVKRKDYGL
jgi:hypothetical protein